MQETLSESTRIGTIVGIDSRNLQRVSSIEFEMSEYFAYAMTRSLVPVPKHSWLLQTARN